MAAVIDACVANLREKVRRGNLFSNSIKSQKDGAAAIDEQVGGGNLPAARQQSLLRRGSSPSFDSTPKITEETSLSESTMCLLMDRFVPC